MLNSLKTAFLVALCTSLCSCCPTLKAEEVLPVLDGRFWDLHLAKKQRAHWSYLFLRDGTCIRYVIQKDGAVSLYDGGDIILSHEWFLKHDTLSVDDIRFQVLAVLPDTITLRNVLRHDTIKLVKTKRERGKKPLAR